MKKLFFLLLLLLPLRVSALGIADVNIKAPSEIKEGDSFTVEISSVLWNYKYDEGIIAAAVEFDYSENVFNLTSVYSDDYDSVIVKQDGKYYIVSVASDSAVHKCADETLVCSPYTVTLAFYVKDSNFYETNFMVKQLELDTFPVDNDLTEYDIDDAKENVINAQKLHVFTITQSNKVSSAPSSIVTNDSSALDGSKADIKEEAKKSSKPYLKSLSIEGYNLDFVSDKYSYSLDVPNDVNTLNINAEPLLDNCNVEVKGADDLKKANDQVKITVSLTDGTRKAYYLQIKRAGLSKDSYNTSINHLNQIFMIAGGVVLFIIIISIISSIHNKRKIKKMLK